MDEKTRQQILNEMSKIPETEIDVLDKFIEPEVKLAKNEEKIFKQKGKIYRVFKPDEYPEINTRDLRTAAIKDPRWTKAVFSCIQAMQDIKAYARAEDADFVEEYNYYYAFACAFLGISLGDGTLLRATRERRLVEEGTQKIIEKAFQEEKQGMMQKMFGGGKREVFQ
jgi:hypothetical protein